MLLIIFQLQSLKYFISQYESKVVSDQLQFFSL